MRKHCPLTRAPLAMIGVLSLIVAAAPLVLADQRRAEPPTFDASDTRGVFFENLSEAFRGERPTVRSLRREAEAVAARADDEPAGEQPADGAPQWSELVSPVALEDEIKRLRLEFDKTVTTPGEFNSGGYLDARVDLSALAMLFAVIHDYRGDVRWKEDAAAARDLLARTAFNSKAGSTQVYNEARLRKTDLQTLVSGGGLSGRAGEPENDWATILDRSPLMTYVEEQLFTLEDYSRNAEEIEAEADTLARAAGVVAVVGEVLAQDGMVQADDPDYVELSSQMTRAAQQLQAALERGDAETVQRSVGEISQSCTECHQQYR